MNRFASWLAWSAAFVALVALAARLVSPDVQPADSGEMQLVTRELGIAHPPGYGLYTLVGHGFGRLVSAPPLQSAVGWLAGVVNDTANGVDTGDEWTLALNFLSAVLAALTLLSGAAAARRLTGSTASGVLAATALALGPTFLAQSGIANVRMPTALLTAVAVALAARVAVPGDAATGRGPRARDVALLALASGLAVGHHPSLVFVVLPLALAVVASQPSIVRSPRLVAAAAAAFLVSLTLLLYLPIRDASDALFAPGNLRSARGLLEHVTGYGFRGDLGPGDGAALADRSGVVWALVRREVGWIGLLFGGLGAAWLVARRGTRPFGAALAAIVLVFAVVAASYRAPQTAEYLMPAYVALSVLVGAGGAPLASFVAFVAARIGSAGSPIDSDHATIESTAGGASRSPSRPGHAPWVAAVSLALAVLLVVGRRDLPPTVEAARPRAEPIVSALAASQAPQGTRVLSSWHFATPLWYAQRYLVPRPDIDVQYVYPEGAEPIGATWARRLAASDDPTVVTNRTPEMGASGIALWPIPQTPFSSNEPSRPAVPQDAVLDHAAVSFADLVALLDDPPAELVTAPGSVPQLMLHLASTGAVTETLTVLAQLVDPETGLPVAQADHSYSAERWNDPRGLVDRLSLYPFVGELPPEMAVAVGVYRSTAEGPVRLPAAGSDQMEVRDDLAWIRPVRRADVLQGAEATGMTDGDGVPFGDALALVAHEVRRVGDELVVDLTWRAHPAASRSDFTVSVQARGDDWSTQHDGTPALGMFPTLKWLPGDVVRDRHRLALPPGLAPDAPYEVTVGVYDAFTLEQLPVTDRDLVAAGQGQAVRIAP